MEKRVALSALMKETGLYLRKINEEKAGVKKAGFVGFLHFLKLFQMLEEGIVKHTESARLVNRAIQVSRLYTCR